MKLKPLILVPVAVSALVLAGCSSDDSSTDSTPTGLTNTSDSADGAAEDTSTCPTEKPASTT
ncbi:hypothetical protein SAMN04488550_2830 [Gordonia malaquae]|nr:hypothetical protein [Gordonia malaquae]SED61433.1 hypothetical protein SAMN04488550_2830 [Gordonia malaquae]